MSLVPDLRSVLGLSEPEPVIAIAARDVPRVDPMLATAELCRRSFPHFVKRACSARASSLLPANLEWGPHLEAIALHMQWQLEDAARIREEITAINAEAVVLEAQLRLRGELAYDEELPRREPTYRARAQRLLINTPPRSLKSVLANLVCAWAWARWPSMQILYVSKNPAVVLDGARMFRDIVSSPWYQDLFVRGAWTIRDDQDALGSVGNTAGGARRSRGISAEILGLNADHIICDDAHSMDDEEDSFKSVIENFDGNVASRLNDGRVATICAIMQRAGRHDFSEHVLSLGWFHLRLPMEFELRPECKCTQCTQGARGEPNTFGWKDWRAKEAEVLHRRYTEDVRAEARRRLRHKYAGQMQQRPADRQGEIFKINYWRWFQIEGDGKPRARPDGARKDPAYVLGRRRDGGLDVDWVCLSVDPTGGSDSEDASALGMVPIVGKGERRLILDDFTPGPQTWKQTKAALRSALIKTSDLTGWSRKILVLVEKKALGPSAISEIEEWIGDGLKNSYGKVIHAKVEAYEPSGKGSKEARADFLEPMADEGLLFMPDGAPCVLTPPPGCDDTIVQEFAGFGPRRRGRDDRVDCVAQCCDTYRIDNPSKKWDEAWQKLFGPRAAAAPAPAPEPTECKHYYVGGRCTKCGET